VFCSKHNIVEVPEFSQVLVVLQRRLNRTESTSSLLAVPFFTKKTKYNFGQNA